MIRAVFLDGARRVVAAPAVLAGVCALTFLLAVPFALTLRGAIERHLGRSLEAASVADAVNYDWWQEFRAQAAGLGTTFSPSIIGFAAVLDNTSRVLDARPVIAPIAGAIAAYVLVWTFVLGGIIDRYARQRGTGVHGFFTASGVFFFRFLRLAIGAGVVYWFLFEYVHPWLFDRWYVAATRNVSSERVAFAWRLVMYAIFGGMLLKVNVILDYAKVRAVVEDRRSMTGAVVASVRFLWRHRLQATGLYLLDAATFLAVLALWALVAPGVGGAGFGMWARFLAGQVYVLARLAVKLQFLSSQTAFFQASLAHARYTALPQVMWPPSPAVEAIANARTN